MDAGTYTVRAINALDKAERQVEVIIYTPPTVEYDFENKCPVRLADDEPLALRTFVGGFLVPNASWSIRGIKLKSGKEIQLTKSDILQDNANTLQCLLGTNVLLRQASSLREASSLEASVSS